jgi:hypothetical protein
VAAGAGAENRGCGEERPANRRRPQRRRRGRHGGGNGKNLVGVQGGFARLGPRQYLESW